MSVKIHEKVRNFDDPMLRQEEILSENGKFAVMPSEEIIKKYISKKTTRTRFEDTIVKEANFPVLRYILSHLDLRKINKILLTYSHDLASKNLVSNVKYITRANNVHAVVDLKKVNENRDLNDYFSGINEILPGAGIYFGCVETHRQRNRRIRKEKKKLVATFLIFFEFVLYRVFPKIAFLRNISLLLNRKGTPVISLAETLGRLVYNGFSVIEYKTIRNLTYFVVMKTGEPNPRQGPNLGFLVMQGRRRKEGTARNRIGIRIHHAYSEYLQDHVLNLNGSIKNGRVARDFRYNTIGRVLYGDLRYQILGYVHQVGEGVRTLIETVRKITRFPRIEPEDIFYIKNSLGKNGKIIRIYKFRTMVKNADKMDNIIEQYDSYGNPVKDPRVTPLGRFMRKVWIDELPQLYSLLKGDIKLVGIRPMRDCDWDRYPPELKEKALKFKPGLMGVQYGTLREEDFNEHIKFFNRYLDQKTRKPFLTDLYYFFRIWYYIFFKGVRSE